MKFYKKMRKLKAVLYKKMRELPLKFRSCFDFIDNFHIPRLQLFIRQYIADYTSLFIFETFKFVTKPYYVPVKSAFPVF